MRIKVLAPGLSFVQGNGSRPDIHVIRDGGLWNAAYVGSSKLANIHAGYTQPGAARTRKEALINLDPSLYE